MKIYQIKGEEIENSRNELTIKVKIDTNYGFFSASAPSGKSKGRYEVCAYLRSLKGDINFLNKLRLPEILCFRDLKKVEKICLRKIGANSLFALEACILKALAKKQNKPLWKFVREDFILGKRNSGIILPRPVGNVIGGGIHSQGINGIKPDFQEFLFIPISKTFEECVDINKTAYKLIKKLLNKKRRNDEGAWETNLNNNDVLELLDHVREEIKKEYKQKILMGLDVAGSSFYKDGKYVYFNKKIGRREQIEYIKNMINKFDIFYIEDPLIETDFSGFAELNKGKCFIVGDDLTVTNPKRLKKAIKMKAIKAIIIKPNQIGSLIKTKKAIEIAKKNNIKTIMSHRSGETIDTTIADLAVAWGCDFIKTGVYGSVRESKLNRLIQIEKSLMKKK